MNKIIFSMIVIFMLFINVQITYSFPFSNDDNYTNKTPNILTDDDFYILQKESFHKGTSYTFITYYCYKGYVIQQINIDSWQVTNNQFVWNGKHGLEVMSCEKFKENNSK